MGKTHRDERRGKKMPRRNLYVSLPGSPAIILRLSFAQTRGVVSVIYIPSVAPLLFAHFSQHRPGEILPAAVVMVVVVLKVN